MFSRLVATIALSVLPLGLALLAFRKASRGGRVSRRLAAFSLGSGAIAAILATVVERYVLSWTELSFRVAESGLTGALLATFLLAAPLEEASKVLPCWSLYRARRVARAEVGAAYAAASGAGFALAENVALVIARSDAELFLVRTTLSGLGHVFFALAWGYALGAGERSRGRFFSLVWFVAMIFHGFYDHILWGRGAGQLAAAVPVVLFMALGSWFLLRGSSAERPESHSIFPEPPSIKNVREALRHRDQPLMLRWIVFGALVTLGLILVLSTGAVFLGRRIGVDFALADQTDVRAAGPLMLLGAAVLLAFPIAGFLIARASAAHSLLEPVLAAAATLALVVALLSLAAPIGVLFALAVAPVALGLTCGGAWVGLER